MARKEFKIIYDKPDHFGASADDGHGELYSEASPLGVGAWLDEPLSDLEIEMEAARISLWRKDFDAAKKKFFKAVEDLSDTEFTRMEESLTNIQKLLEREDAPICNADVDEDISIVDWAENNLKELEAKHKKASQELSALTDCRPLIPSAVGEDIIRADFRKTAMEHVVDIRKALARACVADITLHMRPLPTAAKMKRYNESELAFLNRHMEAGCR